MDWGFDLDDLCDIVGHQRERRFVRLGGPYDREGSLDIDRGTRFIARPIADDRGDDISVADRLAREADGDGRRRAITFLVAGRPFGLGASDRRLRSEEHTSELQSLMRISYAVFCLKKKREN